MWTVFTVVTVVLVGAIVKLHKTHKKQLESLAEKAKQDIARARKDAKKRSGAVQWGLAIENFVPFMKDFPAPPEDCHFFGKPIDFVAFSDLNDKDKCKVHIIEVKSGSAFLNKHQKHIKEAVKKNRVEWHEVRVDGNTIK